MTFDLNKEFQVHRFGFQGCRMHFEWSVPMACQWRTVHVAVPTTVGAERHSMDLDDVLGMSAS
jgi:hypothetical protein